MPTAIIGQPVATAFQLRNFLYQVNPTAPDYSTWFINIGRKYGVRGDIAFCQAVLETAYWRFGGSVLPAQNNFGGLGATGGAVRGLSFPTAQAGIEAMIQHLYAYATAYPLPANTVQIDPRFHLVNRGIAPNWEDLSGRWAADPGYGRKILDLFQELITTQSALAPFSGTSEPAAPAPSPSAPPADGVSPAAPLPATTPPAPPSLSLPLPERFVDIPADAWFAPYVQRALELGILRGRGNGRFDPEAPATRAELAVAMLALHDLLSRTRT